MKLTGARILMECLREQKVDTIFGYPGGTILNVYDALYDYKEITHILTSHEQGAAHAADGYARSTSKVGVCFATSGPGATNLTTGIAVAHARGVLLYTYGVAAGRITAERMADVLSETPAKLYGAYPRKGCIAPGADADIVVYDPEGTTVVTAADQAANVDYAPFEGYEIAGHIAKVFLRGALRVEEGRILDDRGGQFIPRGKCEL